MFRQQSPDAVWDRVERLLDKDPHGDDFNTAHEICSRYATGHDRLAVTMYSESGGVEEWTFQELDRHAAKAARVFADIGLQRGDRIAGLLTRQIETWIVAIAAWRSGLVYVPLFGGFAADAIAFRLSASGAKAVVADGGYQAQLAIALDHADLDIPALIVDRFDSGVSPEWIDFRAAVNDAAADGPIRPTHIDDTATLLFTSGTSGTPKSCMMTHAAFVSVIPFAESVLGVRNSSTVFATADPGWAFGLYTAGAAPMALGAPRVMYSGPFTPEAWYHVLRTSKASVMATAPSAIRRLCDVFGEQGAPATLKTVAVAGEPLTASVAAAWQQTGAPPLRNGYGLSEVGMILGDVYGPGPAAAPGMLTHAVPGFEPLLVADGTPTSDRTGQVAVRRPRYQMASGYDNRPGLWETRWHGDIYVTEDMARIDSEGRWMIEGRADDMIITSGHNVSPVEVENAILRHHAVTDVAAVAHNDPQRGAVVRAVIVLDGDTAVSDDALLAEINEIVRAHVGKYACPRLLSIVEELPRTEVGKLRRAALRDSTDQTG